MTTKRDLLGQLTRDELLTALDDHGLSVADRRKKDAVVEALAGSRAVKLGQALKVGGVADPDAVFRNPTMFIEYARRVTGLIGHFQNKPAEW